MIAVQCAQCDRKFVAEFADAGGKVHCPGCGAWVRVPTAPAAVPVTHPLLDDIQADGERLKKYLVLGLVVVIGVVLGIQFLSPLLPLR